MSVIWKIGKILLAAIGIAMLIGAAVVGYVHWSELHMRADNAAHEAKWTLGAKLYSENEVDQDGVLHFLGPRRLIRSAVHLRPLDFVILTIVVRPDGTVADAWPTSGNPLVADEAVAIARQWKFVPFKRDGRPVWVEFAGWNFDVYPPERRPSGIVPFPQVRDWNTVRIVLKRTACFGTCPAYRLEIRGDGLVEYQGDGFVVVEGVHRTRIPPAAVRSLVDKFRAADFFRLYSKYAGGWTDSPTQILSLAIDGKTMTVSDYVGEYDGMPSAVADLENEVDRVAGTRRWTRSDSQTIPSLVAEGWNFKTNSCENRALLAGVAKYGSRDLLNALLAQGVFPDRLCPSSYRWSPGGDSALAEAASRRDSGMVDALLRAGAASDEEALHYAIQDAAEKGDGEILGVLLRYLKGPASFTTYRGHTALMSGAGSCVSEVAQALLKAGANVHARDEDGNTALISAAGYGDIFRHRPRPDVHCDRTITVLLEAGADPWVRDNSGSTALDRARAAPNEQTRAAARVLEAWMKAHPQPKK